VYFDQALAIDPNDFLTIYYKGTVISDIGYKKRVSNLSGADADSEEALALFDQALDINPDYVDIYVYKAITYNDMNDYETALEEVEQAILINPEHEDARYYKAQSLLQLGKIEEAKVAYRKTLEINPLNSYAAQELADLEGTAIDPDI